jgi:hypothetical protein
MENVMIFDGSAKSRIGLICFIPVLCFLGCFLYFLSVILPLTHGHPEPGAVVGLTRANYDTLFFMLATAAIITAPVFIYCIVLLARFKHLNSATKLMWIVFLSVIAPIASMFFWIFMIKDAPKYVPTHRDIA